MQYENRVKSCQPEKRFQVYSHWREAALDWLLPPRCVLCGRASTATCICRRCAAHLPRSGPACRRCGLPLGSAMDDCCGACLQDPPPFTLTVCPLQYRFPCDRLVQGFKFKHRLAGGRVLSHLLVEYVRQCDIDLPDVLVPVPLHPRRLFGRGFNQAFELAAHGGRALGVSLCCNRLRRRRNTRAQAGLNRRQRKSNVRGAFYWRGARIPGCHAALVDDVMTTGTTVRECARVLQRAGAQRVDVWVTARAIGAAAG